MFFVQAEDGIRDTSVTGVQTCALPIFGGGPAYHQRDRSRPPEHGLTSPHTGRTIARTMGRWRAWFTFTGPAREIGRASCRERVKIAVTYECCTETTEDETQ